MQASCSAHIRKLVWHGMYGWLDFSLAALLCRPGRLALLPQPLSAETTAVRYYAWLCQENSFAGALAGVTLYLCTKRTDVFTLGFPIQEAVLSSVSVRVSSRRVCRALLELFALAFACQKGPECPSPSVQKVFQLMPFCLCLCFISSKTLACTFSPALQNCILSSAFHMVRQRGLSSQSVGTSDSV